MDEIRVDKVIDAIRKIESGEYDSDAVLDRVVERVAEEIGLDCEVEP